MRHSHRLPPPNALHGRVVIAAVAVGAFAAATAGQTPEKATTDDATALAATGHSGGSAVGGSSQAPVPALIPARPATDAASEAREVLTSQRVTEARQQHEAEHARRAALEAAQPEFVKPVDGIITSNYGARWGTTHYGLDIANAIGTPIYSVADGTVLEAGPASGFGLWVRIQHDDGTVAVYGHINSYSVSAGQRVTAGEQIAEVGNRGYSTGPHLHFEIWQGENGTKIDPLSWLAARGVHL